MTVLSEPIESISDAVPVERLEARIVELSSQLAGATCELLLLVGEYDATEGWRSWGMSSTSAWLSWQCGVGRTAAREQVRVARALREFPQLVGPFRQGRLSYSKVRAITRVATAATVDTLIDWAVHAPAAQIERIAAGRRRDQRGSRERERAAARSLSWRWDGDGSLVGSFRLPAEQGVRFLQALEAARGVLPDEPGEVADVEAASGQPCEQCANASAEAPGAGSASAEAAGRQACPDAAAEATPVRRQQRSAVDALLEMAERAVASIERDADGDDDGVGLPGLGAERFTLVLHTRASGTAEPKPGGDLFAEVMLTDGGRVRWVV